jgi:hypothetical protein
LRIQADTGDITNPLRLGDPLFRERAPGQELELELELERQ